jgi:hypothetical protein
LGFLRTLTQRRSEMKKSMLRFAISFHIYNYERVKAEDFNKVTLVSSLQENEYNVFFQYSYPILFATCYRKYHNILP